MNHPQNEELVLLYYGEADEPLAIEQHLAVCEACRAEYRSLQQVLNTVTAAPVPERDAGYGARVWDGLQARLPRARFAWLKGWEPRWWAMIPITAALMLLAFFGGRMSHPAKSPVTAESPVRERVLLVAVGDHLERSQIVLAELSNAPQGAGGLDISDERRRAGDLLDDNRLYLQTARATGETRVASVLDDLDRVLLEIARGPAQVSSAQLAELRKKIEEHGLLFKVRVLDTQVHTRETQPAPDGNRNRS